MNRVKPNRASVGLCLDCQHSAVMRSDRGVVFYRCLLSASDPRFPKYPRLPVVSCLGYRPGDNVQAGIPVVSFTNIRKARLDEAASLTALTSGSV
jgi:hypothetical protein